MAATSSVHLVPQANLNTYSDPPMFRVCNREEEVVSLADPTHLLNGCRVWWEDNHDIIGELPKPSTPITLVPGFIPGFLILYKMRRSIETRYYFQSQSNLRWSAYIADLPGHYKDWYEDILLWVDTEIVRLLSDPKTAKGASKPEKKKRKKPEEVIPKKVHTKASKKRAKPTSSSDSRQGIVPKTVDLTSLAEEGFQQPSIIGGEDMFNFLKGFLEVTTFVM
ncbi:hypothetical protein DVH24_015598 [Malus domestica]|uniref:Uncharacterized protein n=1 Tax=Malus domestica TaxID=3750 RepID=A0A498HHM2_MALDO|nr:hypothetical protein DVH24_015598 [Malus domestica]